MGMHSHNISDQALITATHPATKSQRKYLASVLTLQDTAGTEYRLHYGVGR